MNTKKLKVLTLVAAIAVMSNIFGIQSVFAADQTINAAVSAGSTLSVAVPGGTLNLSGVTASATSTGTSTGTITPITVTDDRGTGAGWTVSSTSTNLGLAGSNVIQKSASTGGGTSTITGDYDGLNPQSGFTSTGTKISGQFVITVNTVSLGTPTQVSITKPDASILSNQAVAGGAITINGVTVTFNNLWAASEVLYINVDHFPYTAFNATPSTLASTNGASTAGMSLQGAATYVGAGATSSSRNELIAPVNTGMGVFTFNLGLSQVTHKFPLVGTYVATVTLTVA